VDLAALVTLAQNGDEEAFASLAITVGHRLHAISKRILRDADLAEDATQQALLDAWRHLPQLRDPERFEAWAYRLVVNACYAEARRERRHRTQLRLLPRDESTTPDPASRLAIQDQLDRAFAELSVEHRATVVLIHYLGMSAAEAADTMGVPVGTARSRLHYALRQLRAHIETENRPAAEANA